MVQQSGLRIVVVGWEGRHALETLLQGLERRLTLILSREFSEQEKARLEERFPGHTFVFVPAEAAEGDPVVPSGGDNDPAYLMFTSGSTGQPKGVPISHRNVTAYVEYVSRLYAIAESDRHSQVFEPTFDLSVHDMFVTWAGGACLCVVPAAQLMAPARFIQQSGVTIWFSTPATAMIMARLRMLKPGCFSRLRLSLFCGEALPLATAQSWMRAAPQGMLENLYGPTEATIAISRYPWHEERSPGECDKQVVPIGEVFTGQRAVLLGEDGALVLGEGAGELCLAGSQVCAGYLGDPEKTARQFIVIPELGGDVWYRTGDRVRYNSRGNLIYLGRVDLQVKVMGHRVELQEVEYRLRRSLETEFVACIAWPDRANAQRLYAFCSGSSLPDQDKSSALAYCAEHLPEYMVPEDIFELESLPLNSNGKINRPELREKLEELI